MAAAALGCGSQRRATDDAPTFAPIPNGDESIPIGPGGWGIQPFGKGAYMVTEGSYQGIYFRLAIEIGLTVNPRYKHTVRRQGYMLISQDMLMSRLHVTGV
jgi:hypothetical protein